MGVVYTYGVGSSLLVSTDRVSSKTSMSGTGNSEGSTLLVHETSVSACFPRITSGKGPKDFENHNVMKVRFYGIREGRLMDFPEIFAEVDLKGNQYVATLNGHEYFVERIDSCQFTIPESTKRCNICFYYDEADMKVYGHYSNNPLNS